MTQMNLLNLEVLDKDFSSYETFFDELARLWSSGHTKKREISVT